MRVPSSTSGLFTYMRMMLALVEALAEGRHGLHAAACEGIPKQGEVGARKELLV